MSLRSVYSRLIDVCDESTRCVATCSSRMEEKSPRSTCSASVAGNYLATITGTSSALSHAVSVVYHVATVAQPDFTIVANPANVTMNVNAAGVSTITIREHSEQRLTFRCR